MPKRRKKKKTRRACLRCDREFMSEGIFNRICPNCKKNEKTVANEPLEAFWDGPMKIYIERKEES